jgi:hypothetical protein
MYLPLLASGNKDRRGAAPCAAPVPLILKRSKGTERVAKFRGSSVCPFAAVSHLRSLCKNNSLLQSAKEMAQCTRINAVARAFLISTEGGCVAAIFL